MILSDIIREERWPLTPETWKEPTVGLGEKYRFGNSDLGLTHVGDGEFEIVVNQVLVYHLMKGRLRGPEKIRARRKIQTDLRRFFGMISNDPTITRGISNPDRLWSVMYIARLVGLRDELTNAVKQYVGMRYHHLNSTQVRYINDVSRHDSARARMDQQKLMRRFEDELKNTLQALASIK